MLNLQILDRCGSLATVLRPYRFLVWTVTFAALAGFAWVVLMAQGRDAYALSTLVLLIWTLNLLAVCYFPRHVSTVTPEPGFIARILLKVKSGLYWLLAVALMLSTVFVVLVSIRMLGLLLKML